MALAPLALTLGSSSGLGLVPLLLTLYTPRAQCGHLALASVSGEYPAKARRRVDGDNEAVRYECFSTLFACVSP